MTISPKKDRYARARGAAQLVDLTCAQCHAYILLYQKDGVGTLKRLYLDRILAPEPLAEWRGLAEFTAIPNLVCPGCASLIGSPMVYRAENRRAIRLQAGSFHKARHIAPKQL